MVVPLPSAGGEPLGDDELIAWVAQLIEQLWPERKTDAAAAAEGATA
jgi:transcription-repair coupling factor (superfamily II helicase)